MDKILPVLLLSSFAGVLAGAYLLSSGDQRPNLYLRRHSFLTSHFCVFISTASHGWVAGHFGFSRLVNAGAVIVSAALAVGIFANEPLDSKPAETLSTVVAGKVTSSRSKRSTIYVLRVKS